MENQNENKKMMFTLKEWHKMLLGGVVVAVLGAVSAVAVHSMIASADGEMFIDPTGLSDDAISDGSAIWTEIGKLKLELEDNEAKDSDLKKQRDDAIAKANKEYDIKSMPYLENIQYTGAEIERLKTQYESVTGIPYSDAPSFQ